MIGISHDFDTAVNHPFHAVGGQRTHQRTRSLLTASGAQGRWATAHEAAMRDAYSNRPSSIL